MTNDIDGAPASPPGPPQATKEQRQAIYRLIVNEPDVVREIVRALTIAEADAVLAALTRAQGRLQSADVEARTPLA